jgi:hypothetical protein
MIGMSPTGRRKADGFRQTGGRLGKGRQEQGMRVLGETGRKRGLIMRCEGGMDIITCNGRRRQRDE